MMKNILLGFLCLALLVGGFYAGRSLEQRRGAEDARAVSEAHAGEVSQLRNQAAAWAAALAKAEGESVLQAFVAGISPAILTGRLESLEMAAVSVLRVPGVSGIHILSPTGKVLYSSDVKLSTTGELGERGAWALAGKELISREGGTSGSRDFAVPLISTGSVVAVVWLEYAETALREAARPPGLAGPGVAREEAPAALPVR